MKKVVLLAGCLSLLAVGFFSASCKKDEPEWKGCTCSVWYTDGRRGSETVTAAELKLEGISSCAEMQGALRNWDDVQNATCTNL